jgi:hypothetical protein
VGYRSGVDVLVKRAVHVIDELFGRQSGSRTIRGFLRNRKLLNLEGDDTVLMMRRMKQTRRRSGRFPDAVVLSPGRRPASIQILGLLRNIGSVVLPMP